MAELVSSQMALEWVVNWIKSHPNRYLIIGIDGFGGSGKSSFARQIAEAVNQSEVIAYDDLYLPADRIPDVMNSPVGIADAYDWQALENGVLKPFRHSKPCEYPVLDWITQGRSTRFVSSKTRVLIVEGVSCTRPELRDSYDIRIWVTAPYEVRLQRGIERDGEAMRSQWVDFWMPAEEIYFAACQADIFTEFHVDGTR